MGDRLAAILAAKEREVEAGKEREPLEQLRERCRDMPPARGFANALRSASGQGRLAVIAEAKRASPSAGLIADEYDPAAIARTYAQAGAACMSVLTDQGFFSGEAKHLRQARAAGSLPVLRKDFIIDEWQVYETRAMGADCMLLIAAGLEADKLRDLCETGLQVGLDVLVEVHAQDEAQAAIASGTSLIGINNRNLTTFETDLATTEKLAPMLAGQGRVIVAESAIVTVDDALRAQKAGAQAILVGEALMRADDPGKLLGSLANPC